jgi:hypothetical protein
VDGWGRIRFVPLRYRDAQTPVATIRARDVEGHPVYHAAGRAAVKNRVRLEYDAWGGCQAAPYVEIADVRSVRTHGTKPADIEDQYRPVCEALYTEQAARTVAALFLRRNSDPADRVDLMLPIGRYAGLEVGDLVAYSSPEVPDRARRLPGVEEIRARVVRIEWQFDNQALAVTLEHIPAAPAIE